MLCTCGPDNHVPCAIGDNVVCGGGESDGKIGGIRDVYTKADEVGIHDHHLTTRGIDVKANTTGAGCVRR